MTTCIQQQMTFEILRINNGTTGNYLKVKWGIQQGCPLFTYLFILTINVLTNIIQNDTNIQDITIDEKEGQISLLTDEKTLIVNNLTSLKNSINTINRFQRCSGLNINIYKTKANYISKTLNTDHYLHRLPWIKPC